MGGCSPWLEWPQGFRVWAVLRGFGFLGSESLGWAGLLGSALGLPAAGTQLLHCLPIRLSSGLYRCCGLLQKNGGWLGNISFSVVGFCRLLAGWGLLGFLLGLDGLMMVCCFSCWVFSLVLVLGVLAGAFGLGVGGCLAVLLFLFFGGCALGFIAVWFVFLVGLGCLLLGFLLFAIFLVCCRGCLGGFLGCCVGWRCTCGGIFFLLVGRLRIGWLLSLRLW